MEHYLLKIVILQINCGKFCSLGYRRTTRFKKAPNLNKIYLKGNSLMKLIQAIFSIALTLSLLVSCTVVPNQTPSSTSSVTTSGLNSLVEYISGDSARIEGTISVAAGSRLARSGVCWNSVGDPRIVDNSANLQNISGINYRSTISGLSPNTRYYVRFYAEINNEFMYGNTISFNSGRLLNSSWAGGSVFYNDGNGGGLVASNDLSVSQSWSNVSAVSSGASGIAIGTGFVNSQAIVAQAGHTASAAQICLDYNDGSYSDWYLPSHYELRLAIQKLGLTASYWSSTEDNQGAARFCSATNLQGQEVKSFAFRVRAIRAFY